MLNHYFNSNCFYRKSSRNNLQVGRLFTSRSKWISRSKSNKLVTRSRKNKFNISTTQLNHKHHKYPLTPNQIYNTIDEPLKVNGWKIKDIKHQILKYQRKLEMNDSKCRFYIYVNVVVKTRKSRLKDLLLQRSQ